MYFINCDIFIFGVANTDWPKVSDKERALDCIELRMKTLQWLACKKTSRKGVKGGVEMDCIYVGLMSSCMISNMQ